MSRMTRVLTGLMVAAPLFAQAPAAGTATARVRIVSQATWRQMQEFTAMSQVRLRGVVEQVDGASMSLRMAFGVVRVELGKTAGTQALRAGDALEVVASKLMIGSTQRLLAMEVIKQG